MISTLIILIQDIMVVTNISTSTSGKVTIDLDMVQMNGIQVYLIK